MKIKGKVLSAIESIVVIKPDSITDIKGTISSACQKNDNANAFSPNKLLNYEILYNNKNIGKISNVIGKVDNFFLVGEIENKDIASAIIGKEIEIKQKRKKIKRRKK